jgi:hypothetical protein
MFATGVILALTKHRIAPGVVCARDAPKFSKLASGAAKQTR